MKYKLIITAAIALIFPALPLHADSGSEADKQALRDLAATYEKAITDDDLSPIAPHLAEGFSGVMLTSDQVEGFAGLDRYWTSIKDLIGEGGSYRITLKPEDTDFRGDLALAKGDALEQVTLPNGKLIEFPSKWTAVCIRQNGVWKLLRVHATINPLENPFTAKAKTISNLIVGGSAGLGGLLLGFLFGRRKRS